MFKIVFLGSKPIGFKCLEFLINNADTLNINIVSVFTNDNKIFNSEMSVKSLAIKNGIPIYENIDDILKIEEVDFIISIQYHQILLTKHICKAKKLSINLHMAPLPEYRGCNQFSFAIINEDSEFGTTIHRIDEGIDSGDIIFEKRFPIPKNCFVKELYDLTEKFSFELFSDKIKDIFTDNYKLIPQSKFIDRKSSIHYRKEMTTLKKIDLEWEKDKIFRYIRATSMPGFEPPFAVYKNKIIEFNIKNTI